MIKVRLKKIKREQIVPKHNMLKLKYLKNKNVHFADLN